MLFKYIQKYRSVSAYETFSLILFIYLFFKLPALLQFHWFDHSATLMQDKEVIILCIYWA